MTFKAEPFKEQKETLHSPNDKSKRKCCCVYFQWDKSMAYVRGECSGVVGSFAKLPWDTGTDTEADSGTLGQESKP